MVHKGKLTFRNVTILPMKLIASLNKSYANILLCACEYLPVFVKCCRVMATLCSAAVAPSVYAFSGLQTHYWDLFVRCTVPTGIYPLTVFGGVCWTSLDYVYDLRFNGR
jgi:hypothetical protein